MGGITPQQAENQHETTRKEAASTSLHKTRDLTHPLRGIAPVTWRCTRYVALHPNRRGAMPTDRVQCLRIRCTTPSVTSSHADLPERTSTYPTGLAGPGGAVQSAGWTPRRQGLTGLQDDEPSGRLAAQRTSGPPRGRLAVRRSRGIKPGPGGVAHIQHARARGAHTTRPGPAALARAAGPGLVNVHQTKRSTIRFANASNAVLASPLGSGASAATASSAQVRAN